MSEPSAETASPSVEGPPAPAPAPAAPRRGRSSMLAAIVAVAVIVVAVAATPFWAPAVMQALPWGEHQEAVKQMPPAPDPTAAAAKAEADQNAAVLRQLTQRLAALEAKPAPPAAAPPPDLGPLEQQLGTLGRTTADLARKVDALDKAAQQKPALDAKGTAMALVLLQIRAAVDTGRPFAAEYRALTALAQDHADIAAAAAPLAGPAESGVASRAVLAARLRELAPQIATAKPPPKDTWKSQIVARLRSLVTIRRIDRAGQTPAEAAVGVAERDLASGELAGAVAALDGLAGANRAAAEPWLRAAKQRLAAETALRQVMVALTAALGAPAGKS